MLKLVNHKKNNNNIKETFMNERASDCFLSMTTYRTQNKFIIYSRLDKFI